MTEISCNIIKDLLPLYIEGLTSEESNKMIEDHLRNCEECRKLLAEMNEGSAPAAGETGGSGSDAAAIDFMKKSNRKLKRGVIFTVVAVAALALCLVLARGYLSSRYAQASEVEITALSVEDGVVYTEGMLKNSTQGVKSVESKQNGSRLQIYVKTGLKTPFNQTHFNVRNESEDKIESVELAGRVIWDRGTEIPESVGRVFAARHLYIGDMSANSGSVHALEIPENLGGFTNELQTTQAPYGWTMILNEDMSARNTERLKDQMEYYAAMLIATIDNLDYVRFEYTSDGAAQEFSFSLAEADAHFGGSVKAAARTASGLLDLMKNW